MTPKEIIDKIKSLQNLETELYKNLSNINSESQSDYKKDLVKSINSIADNKQELLNNLTNTYSTLETDIQNNPIEKNILTEQVKILQNVEKQLNQQKSIINKDKKLNINNLRLTEINTYYSQQYNAKYKILKMISIACLPILLIGILKQRYILSSRIASSLASLIIIIALIFVIPAVIDIYMRDNMVYSQYQFPFNYSNSSNPAINEDTTTNGSLNSSKKSTSLIPECVGAECCKSDFMSYDETTKTCKEGFISGQSSQTPEYDYINLNNEPLVMFNPDGQYYAIG